MLFYDFEVFKYDWLVVVYDTTRKEKKVIINAPDELKELYEANCDEIWVGFNNRHYDQYILKGILLGMDAKKINDYIIVMGGEGWQYSREFNRIRMINYDVMPNPPVGLKTMEGFLGSNIKETEVPFDIDRKLTPKEIEQTIYYCTHDVEQTIKIFLQTIDVFDAMHGIIQAFPQMVNMSNIGDSEARITAKVLGCLKQDYDDEFEYFVLPCVQLKKYKYVQDWFEQQRDTFREQLRWNREVLLSGQGRPADEYVLKKDFYKKSFTTTVAGIPHTFGWGGLHGATEKPIHATGALYHVDVNNYYPSMLIAWGLVTRSASNDNYTVVYNTRKQLKAAQMAAAEAGDKEEAKRLKKAQLPYKKMLNALSGGMKDNTNPAYDPRNNNCMCINGQLMLLDLIEHLEVIPGFQLIQSNTDGLIVQVPDTNEAFEMLDDICWEWEERCSTDLCEIRLALDCVSEIYQKDVNNYLWIDIDGGVERIGAYVKELSPIDNDLPILNKALVDYMVKKVPVEQTIMECDDLIMFQKIVKLSNLYNYVEHEHGKTRNEYVINPKTGKVSCDRKRNPKTVTVFDDVVRYTYKSYRVFASSDPQDGRLLKVKNGKKGEKFANTPDHCFIYNDDCEGVKCPPLLDREWYIRKAKDRLKDFGIIV